jgi:3-phosphoshikimate 1-carboxyvinyltransferase
VATDRSFDFAQDDETVAVSYPDVLSIAPVTRPIDAIARIPGSKSITNRALLIAALAEGESALTGALFSDDTRYMAEALDALGIAVLADEAAEQFTVHGLGGEFPATEADLFVGNSGTTMRFLTAAIALGRGRYRVDGIPRMRQRPIQPLIDALNDLGGNVTSEAGTGCPPVIVEAHGLRGGRVAVAGDTSSQYFTALQIASPYAEQGVEIEVIGDLVSKPYMLITASVMASFGVEVEVDQEHWRTFRIAPGQRYQARRYQIEPDASNASYFFAAAAITGGRVRVDGLSSGSAQGDLHFVDVLTQMGARVTIVDDHVEVIGPPIGELRGVDVDMNAISDTAQTLAAIAPFASGPTTIRGVEHMRHKETDRVSALATELGRLGQEVDERPDGLTIHPAPIQPASIETYDDHRMAMSFAIAALRAPGIRILDPACVAKTFPTFFERLAEVVG